MNTFVAIWVFLSCISIIKSTRLIDEPNNFKRRRRLANICNGDSISLVSRPGISFVDYETISDSITIPAITVPAITHDSSSSSSSSSSDETICGSIVDDVVLFLDISHSYGTQVLQIDLTQGNISQNVWYLAGCNPPVNMLASFSDSFESTLCVDLEGGGNVSSVGGLDPYSIHDNSSLLEETVWTLTVTDTDGYGDSGTLNEWGLKITYCFVPCDDSSSPDSDSNGDSNDNGYIDFFNINNDVNHDNVPHFTVSLDNITVISLSLMGVMMIMCCCVWWYIIA